MAHILITGASGFVGSNLTRELLQSNAEITIFIRKQSNLWRLQDILPRLDVNVVDMGDIESLKRIVKKIEPDIVYHLATYGGYPFQQDLETIILNNILYSVNLMHALENSSLERFVNIGSSSEYGVKSKPMLESDITEPVIPYAIAKVAQTLFSKYFFNQYKLPTVTLRLFSVYGPYEEAGRLIY
ncbi:MAG: NAD-dependent epimerase/dehydratase family protein, partial [Patescibacteria group bacterium]|nr:NAD-dependent epimerase/dehydratase family protein [Patescibacteria group bacterium]